SPIPDPDDGRIRLLTAEQVEEIRDYLLQGRERLSFEGPSEPSTGVGRSLESLVLEGIRAKEKEMAQREAHISRREKTLDATLNKLETLVNAIVHQLRPELQQRLAQRSDDVGEPAVEPEAEPPNWPDPTAPSSLP